MDWLVCVFITRLLLLISPVQADEPQITSLNIKCDNNGMSVSVDFDKPFNGIIFSKGYYRDLNCRYVKEKSDKKSFQFQVPASACGTSLVTATEYVEQFENVVIFQNNAVYQEVWDSVRLLSCRYMLDKNGQTIKKKVFFKPFLVNMLDTIVVPRAELAREEHKIDCWMEVTKGNFPNTNEITGAVKVGDNLTLAIYIRDSRKNMDIRVKDCYAYDNEESFNNKGPSLIQLTTEDGCLLKPKLMDVWRKTNDTLNSGATIIAYTTVTAFKFPEQPNVQLTCNIELCVEKCVERCPSNQQLINQHVGSARSQTQEREEITKKSDEMGAKEDVEGKLEDAKENLKENEEESAKEDEKTKVEEDTNKDAKYSVDENGKEKLENAKESGEEDTEETAKEKDDKVQAKVQENEEENGKEDTEESAKENKNEEEKIEDKASANEEESAKESPKEDEKTKVEDTNEDAKDNVEENENEKLEKSKESGEEDTEETAKEKDDKVQEKVEENEEENAKENAKEDEEEKVDKVQAKVQENEEENGKEDTEESARENKNEKEKEKEKEKIEDKASAKVEENEEESAKEDEKTKVEEDTNKDAKDKVEENENEKLGKSKESGEEDTEETAKEKYDKVQAKVQENEEESAKENAKEDEEEKVDKVQAKAEENEEESAQENAKENEEENTRETVEETDDGLRKGSDLKKESEETEATESSETTTSTPPKSDSDEEIKTDEADSNTKSSSDDDGEANEKDTSTSGQDKGERDKGNKDDRNLETGEVGSKNQGEKDKEDKYETSVGPESSLEKDEKPDGSQETEEESGKNDKDKGSDSQDKSDNKDENPAPKEEDDKEKNGDKKNEDVEISRSDANSSTDDADAGGDDEDANESTSTELLKSSQSIISKSTRHWQDLVGLGDLHSYSHENVNPIFFSRDPTSLIESSFSKLTTIAAYPRTPLIIVLKPDRPKLKRLLSQEVNLKGVTKLKGGRFRRSLPIYLERLRSGTDIKSDRHPTTKSYPKTIIKGITASAPGFKTHRESFKVSGKTFVNNKELKTEKLVRATLSPNIYNDINNEGKWKLSGKRHGGISYLMIRPKHLSMKTQKSLPPSELKLLLLRSPTSHLANVDRVKNYFSHFYQFHDPKILHNGLSGTTI